MKTGSSWTGRVTTAAFTSASDFAADLLDGALKGVTGAESDAEDEAIVDSDAEVTGDMKEAKEGRGFVSRGFSFSSSSPLSESASALMLYRSFDGALGAEDLAPYTFRTGEVGLVMAVGDWLLCLGGGFSEGSMTCEGRTILSSGGGGISTSSTSSIVTCILLPFVRPAEDRVFRFLVGDSSSSTIGGEVLVSLEAPAKLLIPFVLWGSGDFRRLLLRDAGGSRGSVLGPLESKSGGGRERLLPFGTVASIIF